MPRKLGLPKYIKYTECEDGHKLVSKGEYTGTTEGKFGDQYNFKELDSGEHIVLNKAGGIGWRIDNGDLRPGVVCDITFLGKKLIESGQYKGKESNSFEIEIYDRHELPEDWTPISGPVYSAAAEEEQAPPPASVEEAMDNLQ